MNRTASNWNIESPLARAKLLTNWSNNDPNKTIQLRDFLENKITREDRITVERAKPLFWQNPVCGGETAPLGRVRLAGLDVCCKGTPDAPDGTTLGWTFPAGPRYSLRLSHWAPSHCQGIPPPSAPPDRTEARCPRPGPRAAGAEVVPTRPARTVNFLRLHLQNRKNMIGFEREQQWQPQ